MSADSLIALWKDVRSGLIQEAERIPADQYSFRATGETRSVAEVLQHIIQSERFLIGETCREDCNLMRQSFADHIKEYGAGVANVSDKEELLALLQSSMEQSMATLESFKDKLDDSMTRFDGRQTTKLAFLTFAMSHEMYHRGQLTVYERLLNIEPVLTERLKKLFAAAG
jgi:uncharacterized damage-inducible protein DinB